MNITINLVEAASNIASEKVVEELEGKENLIFTDDPDNDGWTKYTEYAQELYNAYYDEAWTMLEQTAPPTYQEEAMRTVSDDYPAIEERLKGIQMINLLHSAIGLATEAGEALDMLKKHIFYGRPLDLTNFGEELGDCQWYAAIGADAIGTTLETIQATNVAKLHARYPVAFTPENAENRDLRAEREILEG